MKRSNPFISGMFYALGGAFVYSMLGMEGININLDLGTMEVGKAGEVIFLGIFGFVMFVFLVVFLFLITNEMITPPKRSEDFYPRNYKRR